MAVLQDSESQIAPASISCDQFKVIRRNGSVVPFEPAKISIAMAKAFIAVNGGQGAASARVREMVEQLTAAVVGALLRRQPHGGTVHIEDIQDQVELSLMRSGEHDVARSYVLYREERARERSKVRKENEAAPVLNVNVNGTLRKLNLDSLEALIKAACTGLEQVVDVARIMKLTLKDIYDGVTLDELRKCTILSARSLIEQEPAYSQVTARLLLNNICSEVLGEEVAHSEMHARYAEYFPKFIKRGVEAGLLSPEMAQFDLARLGRELDAGRDLQFGYLGLQTLYDRYFLHVDDVRI
ncbi:MAG TPA: ATP cone domain-containing protein, partial [Gallionellaceae bacterium]|nr:ATP cone domain-containing protein [Gallionellaceae bacterium]